MPQIFLQGFPSNIPSGSKAVFGNKDRRDTPSFHDFFAKAESGRNDYSRDVSRDRGSNKRDGVTIGRDRKELGGEGKDHRKADLRDVEKLDHNPEGLHKPKEKTSSGDYHWLSYFHQLMPQMGEDEAQSLLARLQIVNGFRGDNPSMEELISLLKGKGIETFAALGEDVGSTMSQELAEMAEWLNDAPGEDGEINLLRTSLGRIENQGDGTMVFSSEDGQAAVDKAGLESLKNLGQDLETAQAALQPQGEGDEALAQNVSQEGDEAKAALGDIRGEMINAAEQGSRDGYQMQQDMGQHTAALEEADIQIMNMEKSQEGFLERLSQTLKEQMVEKSQMLNQRGRAEIRLQLEPEYLGRLLLQLTLEKGVLHGRFMVENNQVRTLIENNLTDLKQSLEEQGVTWEQFSVDLNSGEDRSFEGMAGGKNKNRSAAVPHMDEEDEVQEGMIQAPPDRGGVGSINYLA